MRAKTSVVLCLLATLLGSTPIGAPVVGWVADTFGPRWAMGVAAAAGLASACIGLRYLVRYQGLRLRVERRRLRWTFRPVTTPASAGAGASVAGTVPGRPAP